MTTLTPEDRAQLRDLTAKATPGPWETRGYKAMRGKYVVGPRKPGDLGRGPVVLMEPLFCDERSAADAAFIAAAREAVPALLDALDTAEARADRAEAAARTLGGIVEWQGRDIARIADAEHLVQDDGDADWGMIWDLAEERATRGAAAEAEVERLHSWAGLMELLDEHYPADLIPTAPDDPARDTGPRIVSLIRRVDAAEAERDAALARIDKVRAALAPYAARDHDEACDGDAYCGTDVAEEALCALDGEVEAS